jgi:hypothetical protein
MSMYRVGLRCGFGLAAVAFACDPGSSSDEATGGKASVPQPPAATGGTRPTGTGGTTSTPPPTPAGGSGPATARTITGQYDYHSVDKDGRNYIVQNNVWGANTMQSLSIAGVSFEVTMQTGSNSTSGAPVSYPSVFTGSNYDRVTLSNNMPKQVSALTSVQTTWSQNAGAQMGVYNAAYDVWFSTGASGDLQAPSGGYLMVWFYDPAGAQPIGSVTAPNVTIPGVNGTWDVWVGPNAGKPCISYVAKQPIATMTFDLNLFIQDAVKNRSNTIQAGWYLTNVFAGFEIWSGGVGLKTTDFSVVVN